MSDETREPSTPLREPAESEQNAARQAVEALVEAGCWIGSWPKPTAGSCG
jgi:hypothetical protein